MYNKNRIKTISLSANIEQEITMPYSNVCIRNNTTGVVYASVSKDIKPYIDGVTAIQSGESRVLRDIYNIDNGIGTFYVVSDIDGKIELESANDVNFKCFSVKGGETTYDDTAIKADISNLQTEKANKSEVYTKSETDSAITSKVAEIVADAPEDFDTLKEMSDWIANHENDASAMNSAIQTNSDNIADLQTNKVGFTNYASTIKAGVVKVNNTYGTGMSNDTLEIISATEDDINLGSNDWKPITPYKVPKVMKKYGINSETQIAEMQSDIANKVDNDIFVADNLIPFPFYFTDGYTYRGITYNSTADGGVTITGTPTGTTYARLNKENLIMLEHKKYIVSGCPDGGSDNTYCIGVTKGSTSVTAVVKDYGNGAVIDNTDGSFDEGINITIAVYGGTYDNFEFKPMLEEGDNVHKFQPYKLSRKAIRDDVESLKSDVSYIGDYAYAYSGSSTSQKNYYYCISETAIIGLSNYKSINAVLALSPITVLNSGSAKFGIVQIQGRYDQNGDGIDDNTFTVINVNWIITSNIDTNKFIVVYNNAEKKIRLYYKASSTYDGFVAQKLMMDIGSPTSPPNPTTLMTDTTGVATLPDGWTVYSE